MARGMAVWISLAMGSAAMPAVAAVWHPGPTFPGGARKLAAAVNQGGTLVVMGGRPLIGGQQAPTHTLAPGASNWVSQTPLDFVIFQPGVGLDPNGTIIVVGGWSFDNTGPGFFPRLNGFFYDPVGGEGNAIASLNCSRAFFGFASDPQSRFYAISGLDQVGGTPMITDCVERYLPASDLWEALAPLPQARQNSAAVHDGQGHIVVIGGGNASGSPQSTVFSLDVATGVWSMITPQPMALQAQSAVLGADGLVYVFGGYASNANFPVASVFVLNPVSNTWSIGPSLATARQGAATARDDDGFIWALGGSGAVGTDTTEKLDTNAYVIDVALRVVDVAGPTTPEEGALPTGLNQVCPGSDFLLELWVSQIDGGTDGIAGGSVDVSFDPLRVTGVSIDHGSIYNNPANPDVIDNGAGLADNVGGATLTPGIGDAPNWALLARVRMTAGTTGPLSFSLAHGAFSFALAGGTPPLPASEVNVSATLTVNVGVVDDGVGCTTDSCEPATGQVSHLPVDAACGNGLFCDGTETCHFLLDCQAGTPPNCSDTIVCTDDSCNETTDSCDHVANNANCDNGLFCDGSETCDAALDCQTGTPPTIDDGVACTDDSCDDILDVVVNAPNNTNCDNGLFCDGFETCHATLDCQTGAPPVIDDGVTCTDDSCDEVLDVVVNAPNNGNCDNGLFCDGAETCSATLDCQAGTPPVIDDGVTCTDDSCDEVLNVVVHAPNDAHCDNTLFCDGLETCNATLDCQAGTAPVIDDGVICTDDSCDEGLNVVVNAPNNTNCDNGLFCDGIETCHATLDCQTGTPPVIDDGVACTDDACDEINDVVVNTPNDANCDNGLFCDGPETCNATLDCQTGTPPGIDDGVACTDDSCDETLNVVVNAPNDTACDNALFCDGPETCDATLDCQAGVPPVIDDGVSCTDDFCDEAGGAVIHTPNDASCDDAMACTFDTCDPTVSCVHRSIYDLETNGVVDLGDFSLFASHFATFTGDPAYLDCADFYFDGVIEAADVSFFATAMGIACVDPSIVLPAPPHVPPVPCPMSPLTGGGGAGGVALELHAVALQAPTLEPVAARPPTSWTGPAALGQTFVIEVWAHMTGETAAGITGGTIDVLVDPALAWIGDVSTDNRFGLLAMGGADPVSGVAYDVGGATLSAGVGVGTWVRFAQVEVDAIGRGVLEIGLRPGRLGFSQYSQGTIEADAVTMKGSRLRVGKRRRAPRHLRGD